MVPVVSSAPLADGNQALAISHCDPGEGLDLTRQLEVWVLAQWSPLPEPRIALLAGEGVGRLKATGDLCISAFARDLLDRNLLPLLPDDRTLQLEVVLPRGRELATRTSNAAFGVVDGLALIGLQAEVQRSAAPDQLQQVLERLKQSVSMPTSRAGSPWRSVRTASIWPGSSARRLCSRWGTGSDPCWSQRLRPACRICCLGITAN